MAMELSQEKKTQIAACHAKGMTVKEIAEKAKLTEAQVDVFLQSIGKKPLYRRNSQKSEKTKRSYNRLTEEQKEKILELSKDGLNMYEIAEKLDIKPATVYKFLHKVKEKEPATAATVTDSEVKDEKENVSANSFSNNNTDTAKSQVLSPFTALTLLEALLDNWVGNEYEKYYMQAYEGDAEFIFIHEGRKYSFQFKECKEDSGE
jgi:DNA-binding CsgD family transcriptional regulator